VKCQPQVCMEFDIYDNTLPIEMNSGTMTRTERIMRQKWHMELL